MKCPATDRRRERLWVGFGDVNEFSYSMMSVMAKHPDQSVPADLEHLSVNYRRLGHDQRSAIQGSWNNLEVIPFDVSPYF